MSKGLSETLKQQVAKVAQDQPMPGVVLPAINSKLTLHVDGDYAAYFCAGNDETEPGLARQILHNKIEAGRAIVGASKVVVHLTMSGSHKGYRFQIATVKPYQGQRSSGRKPKNWEFLRTYMETYRGPAFKVKLWKDREADDGLAFVSANTAALYDEPVAALYTADKDMRMLSGLHVDWKNYLVTEVPPGAYDIRRSPDGLQFGLKWFWLQMLQGDTADHIPGLPKLDGQQCGEARAAKYLMGTESVTEAFDLVAAAYARHYGEEWQDRFVEQAALLWLRRDKGASVRDFTGYLPAMNHPGMSRVLAAAARLEVRVLEAFEQVESIRRAAIQAATTG